MSNRLRFLRYSSKGSGCGGVGGGESWERGFDGRMGRECERMSPVAMTSWVCVIMQSGLVDRRGGLCLLRVGVRLEVT